LGSLPPPPPPAPSIQLSWGLAGTSRGRGGLILLSVWISLSLWGSVAGAVAQEEEDMDLASVNEELAEIDGQIGDILRALQ